MELFRFFPKDVYCWFRGGVIRSIFDGSEAKDLDVFVSNPEDQKSIARKLIKDGARFVGAVGNAVTYGTEDFIVDVFCEEGWTPEDSVMSADYTISACAVDCHGTMFYHKDYEKDATKKRLQYIGNDFTVTHALNRIRRLIRFRELGYSIDKETMMRILHRMAGEQELLIKGSWKPTINKFRVIQRGLK